MTGLTENWRPMESAPKDEPILAWCQHSSDAYHLDSNRLTTYGAHAEVYEHAEDGPHVLVWGGGWNDSTWESPCDKVPDWWYLSSSDFCCPANPIGWLPIPSTYPSLLPKD